MFVLQMLDAMLEKNIINRYNHQPKILKVNGVMLLSPDEIPTSKYIYVADVHTVAEFLLKQTKLCENIIIFVTGDSAKFSELSKTSLAIIYVTDLDLITLHNKLARQLELYKSWRTILNKDFQKGIFGLLKNGGKIADASVYLINPQNQIIAGSTKPEYTDRLPQIDDFNQVIKSKEIQRLFVEIESGSNFAIAEVDEGITLCAVPVQNSNFFFGYILAASKYDSVLLKQILFLIAFNAMLMLSKSDVYFKGRISFQLLIEDFFSKKPANSEDFRLRAQRLPNVPKKYMRVIICRQRDKTVTTLADMIPHAEKVFPCSNFALLDDELFILISSDYANCPLCCNTEEFDDFLNKFDAFAIISNPTKTSKGLRVMYHQCKGVFDVALAVRDNDESRFFYFEEYSQYYIIHMCAQQAKESFSTDDIVFLCHPGVLALTRYDRANNGDLLDVMYNFLINRCSISKTAKRLFMHRNTIIYKINKVEEIIGQPLDEPFIRQSLIFSYMIIKYRLKFQKINIKLSDFERRSTL